MIETLAEEMSGCHAQSLHPSTSSLSIARLDAEPPALRSRI
jgi:hypothetical protein